MLGGAINSSSNFKKRRYPDLICANYKLIDKIGNFKKKDSMILNYTKIKRKILLNF